MGTQPRCVQTPINSNVSNPIRLENPRRDGETTRESGEERTQHDQPLGVLDTVIISLGVS